MERLYRTPDDLKTINRRLFEVVAEIFHKLGFEVELTRQTRDGGKDIIAISRRPFGLRFLIECKRPNPGNPVRVAAVRELLFVKGKENATKGILVTTTRFTADARILAEQHLWELELRAFDDVTSWVADHVRCTG